MSKKIETFCATAQKLAGKLGTNGAAGTGNENTLSPQVAKAFLQGNSYRRSAKNIKRVNFAGLNKMRSSFYDLAYSWQNLSFEPGETKVFTVKLTVVKDEGGALEALVY